MAHIPAPHSTSRDTYPKVALVAVIQLQDVAVHVAAQVRLPGDRHRVVLGAAVFRDNLRWPWSCKTKYNHINFHLIASTTGACTLGGLKTFLKINTTLS